VGGGGSWDNLKRSNLHASGVPEEKGRG
jgi:hypothetical protein